MTYKRIWTKQVYTYFLLNRKMIFLDFMPKSILKKIGSKSLKFSIRLFMVVDFGQLSNVDKDISIMLIQHLINLLLKNGLIKVLTFYSSFMKNMGINGL
jgi:hypothetical protein